MDPDRFQPRGPRLRVADASSPTLLFVGRFYRRKGLPVLLRAMPTIAREIPDVRLLVVVITALGLLACGRYGPPARADGEPVRARVVPQECLQNPDAPCPEAQP